VTSFVGGDASITSPSTNCCERSPDQAVYDAPRSYVESMTLP
jgi:hypothetical protein